MSRIAALLIVCMAAQFARGQDDDLFAKTDPAPKTPLAIPVGNDLASFQPTFGEFGCPVAVVGTSVWELETGKKRSTLEGEYDPWSLRCVSDDGRFFAATDKGANQTEATVMVWDTQSGQKVFEIPGFKEKTYDYIIVSRNKYLILGGRHSHELEAWDIENKKQAKVIPTPLRRVEDDKIAFTSDGRYFACVADDGIGAINTSTGKIAVMMQDPAAPNKPAATKGKRPLVDPNRIKSDLESKFIRTWVDAIAFSFNNQELAAVSRHDQPRLFIWNTAGKLNETVVLPRAACRQKRLLWLPDGTGWVIDGNFIDRKTRRVVAAIRRTYTPELQLHLVDLNTVLATAGERTETLTARTVPWKEIRASLAKLEEGADAHISPNHPVTVALDMQNVRSGPEQVQQLIYSAVVKRLGRDKIEVKADQPTLLVLRYAEKAGDLVAVYSRQSIWDFRGTDTGRRVTESEGTIVAELLTDGGKTLLWRDSLKAWNSRSFTTDVNDETVRQSMLDNLAHRLDELSIPYFLPKSEAEIALPVILD
ncbi:MAG TPA: hypothetical protein VFB96_14945 [Pirellulaceae bacterium]|nr:hypothetical protein [Pirellulaceae bacterium]